MAFTVYPIAPAAPLSVPAAGTSPLTTLAEHFGPDPEVGGAQTMFIRIVKLGAACAPSGPPHPTIQLKAGAGPTVTLPAFPITVTVTAPGGVYVGDATMEIEANDIYRVRVFGFVPGNSLQLQLVNTDAAAAHEFTWVVASSDAETRQPWIDAPTTLSYDVLTAQAVLLNLLVSNKGTGPLTITDAVGFSPGAGFAVTAVPAAIQPNACANLGVTFTGGGAPAQSAATYNIGSGDTTAQTVAGHNRRVALSATTRRLEIMLLLDASGSMNAKPNGDPIVAATDSRWSKMLTAANQFLDLIAMFGTGSGRFGVARFPDAVTCPTSQDIQTATDITVGNVNTAKTALATNVIGNMTPIGHGIGRVIGTTSGSFGYFEAAANSVNLNRRWLVLMSDGDHNCSPPVPADFFGAGATSFQGKKIAVMTIGFGDPGASSYAPNHALLTQIATASGPLGSFLDAGADDNGFGLLKSFRTAVADGLSLDPTTDPIVTVTATKREIRPQVLISPFETKAAFVVNWGTSDPNRVRVQLLTPNCELITPAVAQADPDIELASDARYRIYTVNDRYLRNASDPSRPRYGEWTLIASADGLTGTATEQLEYEVIFASRLNMVLAFNRQSYGAGDTIVLTATLTVDGQPLRGANVKALLRAPGQFGHNWLAAQTVSTAELTKARAALTQDADAIAAKTHAVKLRGQIFSKAISARTLQFDETERGVYEARVEQTATPGTYIFDVTATGNTPEGLPYRREKRMTAPVTVRPDPKFTVWDVNYRVTTVGDQKVLAGDVRVFPRDRFGNVVLVDPAINDDFAVSVKGGEPVKSVRGNLDGSYTQQILFSGNESPVLTLRSGPATVISERAIASPKAFQFANEVHTFTPGRSPEGQNKFTDPKRVLGEVSGKSRTQFAALGAFGALAVGVKGKAIVGGAADDILVVVRPDEQLRPYRVEALVEGTRPRWVSLGDSPGVTQTFSLRKAKLTSTPVIRIVDRSGQTRDGLLKPSASPGVSIAGVGFRKTAAPPKPTPRPIFPTE